MRVDVHAHLFPAAYLDALDAARGDGGTGTAAVRGLGGGDGKEEMEARLAAMDAVGVKVQVLSTCPQDPYVAGAIAGAELAKCANTALAHTARVYPDRFRILAALPLPHVLASVDELGRAMDEDGALGASVAASVLGRPLDDHEFEPLFAALNRRRAVLFLHPAGDAAGSPLLHGAGLDWVVGHATELSAAVLRLFRAGLTVKYPDIKIIVPHLGGDLPFLLQRLDRHRDRYLPQDAPSAGQLLRGLYFDTANPLPAALRLTAEVVGAERLVLGTDFPFEQGPSFRDHVEYIAATGLPWQDASAITDDNAAEVLGLV